MRLALVTAVLSLLPLLGILGQGLVVTVVLMRGVAEAVWVAVLASVFIAVPVLLAGGTPVPLVMFTLLSWIPVIALGGLLRQTRSLSLVAQVATVAVVALVAVSFLVADPVSSWRQVLVDYASAMPAQVQQIPDAPAVLSEIMTGTLGLVVLLGTLGSLFIGRWWQAVVQRPGAFGAEFRQLRLGIVLALLAGLVFVGSGLTANTLLTNMTLVLAGAFAVHGLAVAHALAAASGSGGFWLVAVYILFVVAAPLVSLALASIGFADSWFDFRKRLAATQVNKR